MASFNLLLGSISLKKLFPALHSELHPFLRKIKVINAAGDEISFDEKKNIMETYDIQKFISYSKQNLLILKVGEFVFKSPQDQGFFINEVLIQWPSNFNQTPQSVCTQSCGPGFWKVLQEERPICYFSCVFCPECHISNQTGRKIILFLNCLGM
ncbi:vomeronasal type-2 receptor 26-like [Meriones unguiculatus]|uniref:vomeronasal type-2 receptor 26-like n=1 Tax=Meriones unguiculatus TaxID=10047 RepID=UPI00293EE794|nr:vomeronasal type-2 receptor 26-like [Meriones unguiculatus]